VCAPFMGGVADRMGKRRILLVSSLIIAGFSSVYAVIPAYQAILGLVILHGVFWAGLLSASGAYITEVIPASRRAEGLSYWGFASIIAVAIAPSIGLWVFEHGGWTALCLDVMILNLAMAAIAWRLPPDKVRGGVMPDRWHHIIEWRMILVGVTLFLYTFSYGGITSFAAVYADQLGIVPRALYFTAFAIAIILTRPFIARYADQVGHSRVVTPCLVAVAAGVALLVTAETRAGFILSAVVFGTGFGSAYPILVAHVMKRVAIERRGATFGALIGAFDIGVGTGSLAIGWIGEHYGYGRGFAVAAALASLSVPYYIWIRRSQTALMG
jgi:MFS family permease